VKYGKAYEIQNKRNQHLKICSGNEKSKGSMTGVSNSNSLWDKRTKGPPYIEKDTQLTVVHDRSSTRNLIQTSEMFAHEKFGKIRNKYMAYQ